MCVNVHTATSIKVLEFFEENGWIRSTPRSGFGNASIRDDNPQFGLSLYILFLVSWIVWLLMVVKNMESSFKVIIKASYVAGV